MGSHIQNGLQLFLYFCKQQLRLFILFSSKKICFLDADSVIFEISDIVLQSKRGIFFGGNLSFLNNSASGRKKK